MVFSRVEAFAPATVANLGVGFDIMGLALQGMGDRAIVEFQDAPEIIFSEICGDEGKKPPVHRLHAAEQTGRKIIGVVTADQRLAFQAKWQKLVSREWLAQQLVQRDNRDYGAGGAAAQSAGERQPLEQPNL